MLVGHVLVDLNRQQIQYVAEQQNILPPPLPFLKCANLAMIHSTNPPALLRKCFPGVSVGHHLNTSARQIDSNNSIYRQNLAGNSLILFLGVPTEFI